ncbi:hypothetical protein MXF01_01000 [Enterococcus casseliflavus]|uniref:hypothetical protein n=1 Tax=Enterococcus casseliflavus TaxID=37734 RepID=UPI002DB904A1|nr:hypothetical protein [Enterococcus casseliflavus]MEB6179273.1 hypothetical protein [Enterococcus casseliflavus]
MIKQRFFLKQQHTVDLALLETWYEQLMPINEFSWGVFEFTREMLRNKVSEEEKNEIIEEAILCGRTRAQKMLDQFDLKKQEKADRAWYLANKLGLTITERSGKPTKFRMVFAQFVMERSIELITEPIAAYTELTQSSEILPKPEVIRGVLIAHEIFHYLEEQHGATMYHITKTIPLWRFFSYEHRSTVGCASEIAAMAFAKELCETDFVPQMLDILLSYPLEVDFSKSIYEVVQQEMRHIEAMG